MREEQVFGVDQVTVDRVTAQLSGIGRLGVAFSGGVDSATLLALAVRALGPGRVVALLGVSPSLAADERTAAHEVARHVGMPVVEVATHEGDLAAYRANGPDRCFYCKDELFSTTTRHPGPAGPADRRATARSQRHRDHRDCTHHPLASSPNLSSSSSSSLAPNTHV